MFEYIPAYVHQLLFCKKVENCLDLYIYTNKYLEGIKFKHAEILNKFRVH